MNATVFKAYVSQCLVPQRWQGAVVVMANLPAHKVEAIAPLLEAVGAKVLYLSPYSPEFNPIEHWWSQSDTPSEAGGLMSVTAPRAGVLH
jgi:transposase